MERVLILGCCGAGKSTLARSLKKEYGLPIIHLDQHYWLPNWQEPTKAVWKSKVQALIAQDRWIMDGNYGGTLDIRIERADTIVYLDASTLKCLYRVLKRIIKYRGKVRPDMPEGCPERFDLDFLHYVLVFNLIRRKSILKKVHAVKNEKRMIISKNDNQIIDFIKKRLAHIG